MAHLNQQLDTIHYLLNQLYFRVAETVSVGDVKDAISTGCVHSTWKEKRERGRGREEGSNRGERKKGRRLREEDFKERGREERKYWLLTSASLLQSEFLEDIPKPFISAELGQFDMDSGPQASAEVGGAGQNKAKVFVPHELLACRKSKGGG